MSFIMLLVSTSLLLDAPFQAVIALGVLAALVGSVIVAQIEQTGPLSTSAFSANGFRLHGFEGSPFTLHRSRLSVQALGLRLQASGSRHVIASPRRRLAMLLHVL